MVPRSLRHLAWCSWLYNGGPIEVKVAEAILNWAKENVDGIWWSEGKKLGSFAAIGEQRAYRIILLRSIRMGPFISTSIISR
jgi:hypothetical protein